MNEDIYIRQELERLFQEWSVKAAGIGAGVFLLFAPLDYVSTPALFLPFLGYRLGTAAVLLGIAVFARGARSPILLRLWIFLAVLISALTIETMILRNGGDRSPYYAGMILLAVVALGLLPSGIRFHLVLAGTIQAVYLLPIVIWDSIEQPRVFFTQNYFLLFILAATILIRHVHRTSLVDRIRLAHELAEKELWLGQLVDERTEELMKVSQEWRLTVDSTGDMIMLVDEEGRIVKANLATALLAGRPLPEVVGTSVLDLFREEDLPRAIHPFEEISRTGEQHQAEFRVPGLKRWFLMTAEPARESRRPAGGAVITIRDITELKTGAEERQRLNVLLLQAQKMESIGTFASGIAHDFNNILLAVIGLTDAGIERLPKGHPAREDLEMVIDAAERGSDLVRQLLAFTRQQDLKMRPTDIGALAQEMRKLLTHMLPKNIDINLRLAGPLPCVVADPVQIELALMNLAINARDAMPGGGTLALEITGAVVLGEDAAHPGCAPGCYVVLTVRDTGTGMSPELRERVFDPFFTTKEPGKGTGLGLATVYGIVSQHGGTVRVESELGRGTSFIIYLPASGRAPAPGDGEIPPTTGRAGKRNESEKV